MKNIVAYLLIMLGSFMIYWGYKMDMLPPAVTGVGFILISIVFLKDKN